MAGLPKKLYFILIKPGGKRIPYGKKGGGKYTDGRWAKSHAEDLKKFGANVELYEADMNWVQIPLEAENPMEGMPGLW